MQTGIERTRYGWRVSLLADIAGFRTKPAAEKAAAPFKPFVFVDKVCSRFDWCWGLRVATSDINAKPVFWDQADLAKKTEEYHTKMAAAWGPQYTLAPPKGT